MNRTISSYFTILCLLSTMLLMGMYFNIQTAKASDTIYIRADGSVEGTTDITSADNITYALNAAINDSIVVERSSIIIDGAGYTIFGSGTEHGFNLTNVNNVTINSLTITGFIVGIRLVNSSNNIVSGNQITNIGRFGIWLYDSLDTIVSGNHITNNSNGVYLHFSSNDTISGNNLTNNDYGIWLLDSLNHSISGNNITDNGNGVYLHFSSDNTVSGNHITNNEEGVVLSGSRYNTISGNTITENNGTGVGLRHSSGNTVSANTIAENEGYGIWLEESSSNEIFHNDFIDNTQQVYDPSWNNSEVSPSVNIWDASYPSGGNYWSDFIERYPNATEIDNSGIWDIPYVIDGNNQDNYPIIPEFPLFLILPIFMITTLLAVIIYRRKHSMYH